MWKNRFFYSNSNVWTRQISFYCNNVLNKRKIEELIGAGTGLNTLKIRTRRSNRIESSENKINKSIKRDQIFMFPKMAWAEKRQKAKQATDMTIVRLLLNIMELLFTVCVLLLRYCKLILGCLYTRVCHIANADRDFFPRLKIFVYTIQQT